MRMLSGDANPFRRTYSPSRLVQSKMKSFRHLESRPFKITYKPTPPETIIAEDFSDSNVSILSSQTFDYCDSNKVSRNEMMTKGKFSGMTLQETLAWRHHVSANVKNQNVDTISKKKKPHEQQKRNECLERNIVESTPDFMLARANLKKTHERATEGLRVARSVCSITADSTANSLDTDRETHIQGRQRDESESRDGESRDDCAYLSSRCQNQDSRDSDVDSLLTPDLKCFVSTHEVVNTNKSMPSIDKHSRLTSKHNQSQQDENTSCSISVGRNDAKEILNAMLLSRKREHSPKAILPRDQDSNDSARQIQGSSHDEMRKASNKTSILHERLSLRFDASHKASDSRSHNCSNSDSKSQLLSSPPFSVASIPDICEKYSKMLKMGVPLTAVQNSMIRDGVEPSLFMQEPEQRCQKKKDPFRRTRLHWTPVDNYSRDSIWYQINNDSEFQSIPIDEDEFQSLFQVKVQPVSNVVSRTKENLNDGIVKVIDAKRANNGGIILASLRMNFEEIAAAVDSTDESCFTAQQVKGLLEYIPTPKERQALNAFLSSGDDASILSLSECERFMVSLFPVDHVKEKMEVMLFKLQFPSAIKDLSTVIRTLCRGCDEILRSQKLKRLLGAILKIGNHLNQAGSIPKSDDTVAFELESLAKLKQVKAWDRKTTVLSYISSILFKWNEPVLSIKDELPNVLKVLSFNQNDYEESLTALTQQMKAIQKIMSDIDIAPTTNFFLDAAGALDDLNNANMTLKTKFEEVLEYLAESRNLKPIELFCTLSSFCNDIESTYANLKNGKNVKDRSSWRRNLKRRN